MCLIMEADDHDGCVLVAPQNFSMVENGVYRSSFPKPEHFGFLTALNLRSIIYLCPEPYPEEILKFYEANNIRLFQFAIESQKDPPTPIPEDTVMAALRVLVDVRNHPILIHCKAGKHRTGCLVGCLRKVQNWCWSSVLEEYQKYAGSKCRQRDMKCIETFDTVSLRQCLLSIMYRYLGYGPNRKRLLYGEENVQTPKPQATNV
ncbi:PREDICTED: probable tyrosine-protein phosphatase At1g05000 [Brassica oleracea var. oleracea]|uniref:diphosphoinositol-polyphosphate diphosphatase n=1 Tax=Brassica oleracea var. oleracea TaxID=109376 RepID=A0A0D3CN70_BRAOL|nr:PREDICTED: probable tyrosine-protein phosphatase At1g05000 [Brassica oleracea var. oleracea]